VASGAEIVGLILERGKLVGVVAGPGPLPGRKLVGPFGAPRTLAKGEPPETGEPYVQIDGTLDVLGVPAAEPGQKLKVFGRNFCGDDTCGDAVVRVDGQVVDKSVEVAKTGGFVTAFFLEGSTGRHLVTATQVGSDGKVLRSSTTFIVPVAETEGEEG
jgi:hypothetical protein